MKEILTKIFGGSAVEIGNKLSGIVDKFVHTKDEKAAFEKEMTSLFINAEAEMQKNVTERWTSDMSSDNLLSKSVRPLVLIFIVIATVLLIFIDSGFITFAVDDEWKDLLKIILLTTIGAYFGGRSYEKGKKIAKK
jgi:hypothetical protein|tara:strand:+ start:4424 stop:4831 length:408 start_codon:yes stop_codon:yes gene_type:complete